MSYNNTTDWSSSSSSTSVRWYDNDNDSDDSNAVTGASLLASINGVGLLLNIFYVIVVWSRPLLHAMTHYVLVGQAIFDLGFAAFNLIIQIRALSYFNGKQREEDCVWGGFGIEFPLAASIAHFCLISLIRRITLIPQSTLPPDGKWYIKRWIGILAFGLLVGLSRFYYRNYKVQVSQTYCFPVTK
jgi:hypothetical protein